MPAPVSTAMEVSGLRYSASVRRADVDANDAPAGN